MPNGKPLPALDYSSPPRFCGAKTALAPSPNCHLFVVQALRPRPNDPQTLRIFGEKLSSAEQKNPQKSRELRL
jgi:hypothetical protein